ncbi:hypothetical protein [Nocardia goodfellowii]|uniref:CopG family transcriptional regulator n=1 Tax=Nocardia goodfellowii TaxID=882446 RepID=A0ABS4QMS2_9NOCA|nr:hypothetical protein [Nocardia goodfellowii]MBP2193000.1 hypothetical protein [Nocardia goodfellowii]
MTTRDVTVTVSMDDVQWSSLRAAADCAGMSVEAYLCWGIRLIAAQSLPGKNLSARVRGPITPSRTPPAVTEDPASAWMDTFSERLTHRAEPYREI